MNKQNFLMTFIWVCCSVFFTQPMAFGHIRESRITKIRLNKQIVRIYSAGKPVMTKSSFEKHHQRIFLLSFHHAILIGKRRVIYRPSYSISKLVLAQFRTRPNIVHVVIRESFPSTYSVEASKIKENRYLTRIYPVSNFKVFIDAGHGGNDPGGVGPLGLPESFVNISVAMRVKKLLEEQGVNVELDRKSDSFVGLPRKVRKANKSKADLFVGLYCNASEDCQLHGTTTYYYHDRGHPFADYLENYVSNQLGTKNDGTVRDDLYVIRNIKKIPAVLIEYAYISNRHEEKLLASPWFRHRIALAIANAIYNYYILHKESLDQKEFVAIKG